MADSVDFGLLSNTSPGIHTSQPQAQGAPSPSVAPSPSMGLTEAVGQQQLLGMEKAKLPGYLQGQALQNQGAALENQSKQAQLAAQQYAIKMRTEVSQAYTEGKNRGGTQGGLEAMGDTMLKYGDTEGYSKLQDTINKQAGASSQQIAKTGSAIHQVMTDVQPATPAQQGPNGQMVPGNPGKTALQSYAEKYQTIKRLDPSAPDPRTFKDDDQFLHSYVMPTMATALPIQEKIAAEQKALTDSDLYKAQAVVKSATADLKAAAAKDPKSADTQAAALRLQQANTQAARVANGNNFITGTVAAPFRAIGEATGLSSNATGNLIESNSPQTPGKPSLQDIQAELARRAQSTPGK